MTSSAPTTDHLTSHVTTHVLDTTRGRPAAGMAVLLEVWRGSTEGGSTSSGATSSRSSWECLGQQSTDTDGRCTKLGPPALDTGRYRLTFDTDAWFTTRGDEAFYPEVVVVFAITDVEQRYHVPVLLSPFAYSTYRGS